MSFPPRHGIPPLFMGVPPPPVGIPPPSLLSVPPPPLRSNHPPMYFGGPPPPRPRPNSSIGVSPYMFQAKPTSNLPYDHPTPIPVQVPSGPSVTVFVGNITDKWPDAMIRQLLSTCGYVLSWKRIQGASGRLQGFGFCEFAGPDAGLRSIRLLHELEVGEKKLVVKVDAKTNIIFDEFKTERKRKKELDGEKIDESNPEDYINEEMKESDERSKLRISSLFREFKAELDSYQAAGADKPDKDPATKQAIQDKLHLLKLTSLDGTTIEADPVLIGGDPVIEEGRREIISQEIVKFREHMKDSEFEEDPNGLTRSQIVSQSQSDNTLIGSNFFQESQHFLEKEKDDEKKRITKERRDRDGPTERSRDASKSPNRRRERPSENWSRSTDVRSRSRSRINDRRRDDRNRNGRNRDDRVPRDYDRDRDRIARRRSRERDRDRRSRSRNSRERSPGGPPHKRRYREREEEEEAEEQRKQDKKARERGMAYDEKLRQWEQREDKKRRDRLKDKEKQERILEQIQREARNMKEFLEDYDDDGQDIKFYKGKPLQIRLSERTKELESDNRDRQREREEIEEMRLKVLTSGGVLPGTGVIPIITLDRRDKKPLLDTSNITNQVIGHHVKKASIPSANTVTSRLQIMAGQAPSSTQANGIHPQSKSQVIKSKTSDPSTPNSLVSPSPGGGPIVEMSPSIRSLANTGFTVGPSHSNNVSNVKDEDDTTRNSYSSVNSLGDGVSPVNFDRDDDSSLQDMSPDFQRKKRMDVKDVFNQEEEDDGLGSARKRKLVPLDYGDMKGRKDMGGGVVAVDEKKKSIKTLIDRIPTEKDALFAYEIDWSIVDNALMEKRIRPWINKKIVEYIGEPEPTLVDFICSKVLAKSNPAGILEDVQMVLDDEAEVFVVKMWRLLVYEIEAKKIGLASKS